MTKFHISNDEVRKCVAVNACPIGGEHFESQQAANRGLEAQLANEYGGSFNDKNKKKLDAEEVYEKVSKSKIHSYAGAAVIDEVPITKYEDWNDLVSRYEYFKELEEVGYNNESDIETILSDAVQLAVKEIKNNPKTLTPKEYMREQDYHYSDFGFSASDFVDSDEWEALEDKYDETEDEDTVENIEYAALKIAEKAADDMNKEIINGYFSGEESAGSDAGIKTWEDGEEYKAYEFDLSDTDIVDANDILDDIGRFWE